MFAFHFADRDNFADRNYGRKFKEAKMTFFMGIHCKHKFAIINLQSFLPVMIILHH